MVLIPQAAPHLRYARYRDAIDARVLKVLRGTRYILGEEVDRFECDFAAYLGVRHCVGVNSGTDAMTLALAALGIAEGDEVITVSLTAAGTVMPVLQLKAMPRFVDVDPPTHGIDLAQLEAAITPRSAAILPVHLHGYPVNMPALMAIAQRHGLAVIEDCAQAHGARVGNRFVGTFGDMAIFSFYPTKNLGCAGDGGAVVTNDDALAKRLRSLRELGWSDERRLSYSLGFNSRLAEVQAAVLNSLLPHLEEGNRARVAAAAQYRALLKDTPLALPPDIDGAVYHQFVIAVPARDKLRNFLKTRAGVETAVHYAVPLHRQPVFASYATDALPASERLADTMISLPIQPEVVEGRLSYIADAIHEGIEQCET
jgi:dTDP-3-amino-3,4,6-trideoxy-alpha-D-glucose transaminase